MEWIALEDLKTTPYPSDWLRRVSAVETAKSKAQRLSERLEFCAANF